MGVDFSAHLQLGVEVAFERVHAYATKVGAVTGSDDAGAGTERKRFGRIRADEVFDDDEFPHIYLDVTRPYGHEQPEECVYAVCVRAPWTGSRGDGTKLAALVRYFGSEEGRQVLAELERAVRLIEPARSTVEPEFIAAGHLH